MPYLGHSPTQAGSYIEVDDFGSSFNGSDVAFTLQVGGVNITPNQQNLLVMIDGVLQQPSNAFSVSGSTITFTEAPANGADLYCLLMGQSASIGQGTIGADELKISGDGTSGQLLKSDGDGTYSYLNQTSVTSGTATTLATARTINGVSFDGSANITVTADANTLSNTTLKSTVVNSSLTSVGTLTSLTTSGNVGVGASPSFKFDVQDNSTTWATRILNTNAGGQALLVRTDATNDATALGVYANGAYRFIVRESDSTAYNTFAIEHGTTPQLYLKDTGGTSNRRVFAISGGGDGIYFEGKNNDNSGDGDAGLMTSYSLTDGTITHHKLTHLKGSAWNNILKLGDTSRSGEQLTHINNGSVNFSIYTSNGTKGVITANHDGSAMTLGADYASGTLSVYAPTTFSKNITLNTSSHSTLLIKGADGCDAELALQSDDADDNTDYWSINAKHSTGGTLHFATYGSGAWTNPLVLSHVSATVGNRFYVTANLDGAFGTELYNASTTGHGLKVRGGTTSAHYSLFVSNNDQTAMNFQVLGDGTTSCRGGFTSTGGVVDGDSGLKTQQAQFKRLSSNAYNNNNLHDVTQVHQRGFVVKVEDSAGGLTTMGFPIGGAGVAYNWSIFDSDSNSWNTNSATITSTGTNGNTYAFTFVQGSGTMRIQRTSGDLNFTVRVYQFYE